MKIGDIDLAERVFVVAEIGNNHEGDFSAARDLVEHAAETGVDAVKFQTFIPEHYVSRTDVARLERLRRFQLSEDQFAALAEMVTKRGLVFFSTPFDIASARFLDSLQPVFKVASGDNTFFPLIETIATLSKPVIVSTGLADVRLLDRLRSDIYRVWARANVFPGLAFLHCVASYPVPIDQANLGAIATLRERFKDCTIGYSDHTLGIDAAVFAVAAGARIIEKHFTLDKAYSDFRDHQLSADPQEMRQLVTRVREVTQMLGSGRKVPQPAERELAVAVRRSIAAARNLPAGTVLAAVDFTWVRPGTGLPPGDEHRLIGRRTLRAVEHGDLIHEADVALQ